MIRLHAVVEGQTEETFVNQLLAPSLGLQHIFISAHRVTTGRNKGHIHRGGISNYRQLRSDLLIWIKQDKNADVRFTTMIDLYRLPADFPGYADCRREIDPLKRIVCLEQRFATDIGDSRFIPYIQLHEFEALLFSKVAAFENIFPRVPNLAAALSAIRKQFESPEHINERPDQSPSARILKLLDDYVKPIAGLLIAQSIGLPTLRKECQHFDAWISRLEQLT